MLDGLWTIVIIAIFALFIYAGIVLTRTFNSLANSNDYNPYKQYYSVPMRPEEIYKALSIPAIFGDWKSEFCLNENILYFHHFSGIGGARKFKVAVTEMERFSLLTLSPFPGGMKGVNVNVDAFLAGKLNATPIPNEVMKPHA